MATSSDRVALVTSSASVDHDPEIHLLAAALEAIGLDAEVWAWDEPHDWSTAGAAVVRSTWDYLDRRSEFLAWAETTDHVTRLANPASLLRWNTDKRYLADLAAARVPVLPTTFVAPGDPVPSIEDIDVVVKPTISAGGRLTGRFRDAPDEARAFITRLQAAGHHAMVQPHLPDVEAHGEVDVVVLAGEPSHAVVKGGLLGANVAPSDGYIVEHQSVEATDLGHAPLELVERVLAAVPGGLDLLYARIDCAIGLDGEPVLMEAELVEPWLFCDLVPGGPERFAAATARWLR